VLTGGMTHHLAHHLRPAAARQQLPMIHVRTATALAAEAAEPLRDFPTLLAAVRGHGTRLRELGRSDRPSPIGWAPVRASLVRQGLGTLPSWGATTERPTDQWRAIWRPSDSP